MTVILKQKLVLELDYDNEIHHVYGRIHLPHSDSVIAKLKSHPDYITYQFLSDVRCQEQNRRYDELHLG